MKTERVGFKSLIRKYKASIKGVFFFSGKRTKNTNDSESLAD